jgi:phospholipid/cholesterol/gamma-HCH transport system substrate-binding protein
MTRAARLGVFILAALVILAIAIFKVGNGESLFSRTYRLSARFDTVAGLVEGADVRLGGVHAGTVASIQMPQRAGGKMAVIMNLDTPTLRLVKKDSVASIETEGLLGDKYVSISFGTPGAGPIHNGDIIKGAAPEDLSGAVRKTNQLLDTTNETMKRLDAATININAASTNIRDITGKINTGEGTLGALVNDRSMYNRLDETAAQLAKTSEQIRSGATSVIAKTDRVLDTANRTAKKIENAGDNIDSAAANVKDITGKINSGEGTLGTLVNSNDLARNLNEAAENIKSTAQKAKAGATSFDEDMEALKHNFFLRGFFKARGYENASDLTKYLVPHIPSSPPSREFVMNARVVFKGRHGARLKHEKRLNPIGRYLQDHPFRLAIVVAYTDMKGDSGQDLKLSEAQAYVVRRYIVDNFRLQDTRIKTIGLGKQEAVGTKPENGVEVLVYNELPEMTGQPEEYQLPK